MHLGGVQFKILNNPGYHIDSLILSKKCRKKFFLFPILFELLVIENINKPYFLQFIANICTFYEKITSLFSFFVVVNAILSLLAVNICEVFIAK